MGLMNYTSIQVIKTLRKLTRAFDIQSKLLFKNYGLTLPQLMVLKEIPADGELSAGELSKRISLSQATLSEILDRLCAKGLTERVKNVQDKRRIMVRTTEKAVNLIRDCPHPFQEQFLQNFENLPEWEQTQILASLQRIESLLG